MSSHEREQQRIAVIDHWHGSLDELSTLLALDRIGDTIAIGLDLGFDAPRLVAKKEIDPAKFHRLKLWTYAQSWRRAGR